MLVTAPGKQLLVNYQLAKSHGSYCKGLHDSDRVSTYAVQYAGNESWSIPRLYCRACQSTTSANPTLATTELLIDGQLGCTIDSILVRKTRADLWNIDSISTDLYHLWSISIKEEVIWLSEIG